MPGTGTHRRAVSGIEFPLNSSASQQTDAPLMNAHAPSACVVRFRRVARGLLPDNVVELLLGLVLAAVSLAALARRVGAPYRCSSRSVGRCSRLFRAGPRSGFLPSSRWRSS